MKPSAQCRKSTDGRPLCTVCLQTFTGAYCVRICTQNWMAPLRARLVYFKVIQGGIEGSMDDDMESEEQPVDPDTGTPNGDNHGGKSGSEADDARLKIEQRLKRGL